MYDTTLIWNQVSVSIKDKKIINDCSGFCKPGSMLAIMGPSGAGKTTLLSTLAGKQNSAFSVSGIVEANGVQFSQKNFYNFGSFVFQNDILYQTLTVQQTLQFVSRMKIRSKSEALKRSGELIHQFQLNKCSDVFVGGKIKKGISGGEKKRLCIAVQMVSKPSLLILDEPTSGLDSHMANQVMKVLNELRKQKKTIIFTIHQPSYKIYSLLDRLILLNKGETIYQGPAGEIVNYMETLNINVDQKATISDFFMMEISDYKANKQNYFTPLTNQSYTDHLKEAVSKEMQKSSKQIQIEGYAITKPALEKISQFSLLFSRELKVFFRNPMKFGRAVGNAVITIIIIGLIFYTGISDGRPDPKTVYPDIRSLIRYFIFAQGICFVNVTSVIMNGIFSVSLVFPTEREVFAKETASKTYHTFPYFFAKLIFEGFSICISVILFSSGAYWLIAFDNEATKFIIFTLSLCVMALVGNSIGLLTGALFKDTSRATSLAPAFLLPLMIFSGLYNKLDSIPVWISWLQYISPFRYGLHCLLLNEFGDEVYQSKEGIFDYRNNLSINLTIEENLLICLGLSVFYYTLAYMFLRKLSSKLTA